MTKGDKVQSLKRLTVYDPMTFEPQYVEPNTLGSIIEVRSTKFGHMYGIRYDTCPYTVVSYPKDKDISFTVIDATES